jgi:hypothetical protein
MANTKIDLNYKNISNEILKSSAMEQECRKIAEQIRSRAGSGYEVTSGKHRLRAFANVGDPTDGGIRRESETGNLARALSSLGVTPRYGKRPRTNPAK